MQIARPVQLLSRQVARRCAPSTSTISAVRYISISRASRSSSPSIWNADKEDKVHTAFKDESVAPTQADDPWAIPMQHKGTLPEDIPANPGAVAGEHPEGRATDEATETMRARLVYLSRKRGILEMEMLLSTFIQDRLKSMSREEMQEYDRVGGGRLGAIHCSRYLAQPIDCERPVSFCLQMLTLPDWTLFYWAIGKKEIPADSEWKNSKVLGRACIYMSFRTLQASLPLTFPAIQPNSANMRPMMARASARCRKYKLTASKALTRKSRAL